MDAEGSDIGVTDGVRPGAHEGRSMSMSIGSSQSINVVRKAFGGVAKGFSRKNHGDDRVGMITNQESDKVIIDMGRTDVSRVDGRCVTNVDMVFFSSEDKGIADGVLASKVQDAGVGSILVSTGASTNGSQDVSIGRFGRVPEVGSAKEDRERGRIGHG